MAKREPFFECVFVSEGNEYRFHIRAWNAEEARYHLRNELRSYGVTASGELRLFGLRGGLLQRSTFDPAELSAKL